MALSYDNSYSNSYFAYLYTFDSATGTFSSNLKSSSSFDYFGDSCQAGDCLYFLATDHYAFKNIKLYVGTTFAADDVEFIWEYSTGRGTWAALDNVVNGDALLSTGEQDVTFDIPKLWRSTSRHSNAPLISMPRSGGWIRCRIVSVTNPTEGGTQSTQTVQVGKNLWSVTSGSETFASLRTADVAGGYGTTDVSPSGINIQVYGNITIDSGATLSQTLKQVELINSYFTNNGTFQLGSYTATYDYSYNGCFLYYYGFDYGGGGECLNGYGIYKIYDSKLYCDYPGKFFSGTGNYATGSEIKDSTIEGFYSGCNLNNFVVDRLRVTPQYGSLATNNTTPTIQEMWTSSHFSLAQQSLASVTIENATADYLSCWSVYTARDNYLINPTLVNVNPLRVVFYALGGGDHDVNYHTQYRFDLMVQDTNHNPISGVGVTITDADSSEVFSGVTDENGEIAQQVLTKQIDYFNDPNPASGNTTVSTPTETYVKTPHQIQITATGYITQTHQITMDEKKDLVFTLEEQVPIYIGKGKTMINVDPANSQNNILA